MLASIRNFLCEDTSGSYEKAAKYLGQDEMEEKWPDDVEDAFLEAVEYLKTVGRRKFSINGKLCGRNELISRYVYKKTRKYRSRKQVSSHIQVWKNSKKTKFNYFQTLLQENHSASSDNQSLPSSPCQSSSVPSTDSVLSGNFSDLIGSAPPSTTFERLQLPFFGNEWALLQPYSPALATPAPSITEGASTPSSPTVFTPFFQDKQIIWPNYFGLYLDVLSCTTMTTEQRCLAKMKELHATQFPQVPVGVLSYHTQCFLDPFLRKSLSPIVLMKVNLDMSVVDTGGISDVCITETSDGRPLQCVSNVISFGRQVFSKAEAKASVLLNSQHVYHFDFVSQFFGVYLNHVKALGNVQAMENSLRNLTICQTYSNLMSDQPLLTVLYEFDLGDGTVEPSWVINMPTDNLSLGYQLTDVDSQTSQ
ncbi:TEA/ATTS domain family-domain-containing protein [Dimargaris cristalligena]|uniref:TEA/ATTS domain family-domain-containing protein n=1 Tax=Dimargaris cristalligena TaxID=215637 RepID=A0A4P9ZX74_9FUNG|nr:TEA/ATTS domain family-domain-containing protein [Dimargaris cristalligena]|eukprot:RKP37482.1 TEA/ATTS domain family-domain-containing protein [Dimargaris cristalligena]